MNPASDLENIELAKAHAARNDLPLEKENGYQAASLRDVSLSDDSDPDYPHPTEEELATLRRVSGKIPWTAFTIAFVELCERFSYYGTTAVFVNFIQQPLPDGSNTGAGFDGQSGALDMGQRASTGLTTFNAFWAYVMPLLGAYMADTYWGRFKTIQISIGVALVGHIILIISAIPPVIVHPTGAIAAFAIGIVIMGVGVGGFKSNVSPLIAEQYKEHRIYVFTDAKGERVIHDPSVAYQRVFMYFYLMINIGSLAGSIGMVYAEKYVGFWLSFLLPTLMLCLCPMVTILCKKRYILSEPQGSIFGKAMKVWGLALKGTFSWNPITWSRNLAADDLFEKAKPSNQAVRPVWMTFDDAWVDEVRRGLLACRVFLWYPIYWLAYGQMTNNLTSQAATMELNGVPNDIISNLNPISIILFIPLMDFVVYPGLRKAKINFSPIKRITCGFFLASLAMVSSTVIQYYIYKLHPLGNRPNTAENGEVAPINVWVQTVPYALVGFSEIMASITGLEYAFTKAPNNMKSMVTAVSLLMNAFSSAIAQGLVALSEDPLLIWNYGVVAVLAFVGGVFFWLSNRKIDRDEDSMNMQATGNFGAKNDVASAGHGRSASESESVVVGKLDGEKV